LNLANTKIKDVAVPANLKVGLLQDELEAWGWSINIVKAKAALGDDDMSLIDLRDRGERERHGAIAAAVHAPYTDLVRNLKSGGL
jgi:sulfur dioxygenase